MRPYDALTDIDIKTIQYYLEIYGAVHSAPLPQVLAVWNKNKATLFKAFGKKLRIEKQIFIPKNTAAINRQLQPIYNDYPLWYDTDIEFAKNNKEKILKKTHNEFIADVIHYWVNQNYQREELFILSRLFCLSNVSYGYIDTIAEPGEFHFSSFKATVKNGMKTIRTIQKILKATNYPNMNLFEEWRNAINCISIGNNIQAKLVLSIHPIDFMSMSDNNCNWSSCMSWGHNSCYRAGTLEMMNSNLAIVAYLEGPQTFKLDIGENESYFIPNKSWRSLFYVHKNILLSGKSYPYHNKEISFQVLDILKDLVKKNLNWDYQFGIQEYQDMKNLDGNFYVRDFFDTKYDKKKQHHCIFVYTNGMYNDIIESHSPAYYCYRNRVPKSIKLCLSGPATCICCGKKIIDPLDSIYSYDELGSTLTCTDCNCSRRCRECGNVNYHIKYKTKFGKFCSDKCCSNYVYFPDFKEAVSKRVFENATYDYVTIFTSDLDSAQCQHLCHLFDGKDIPNFVAKMKLEYGDKINIYRTHSGIAQLTDIRKIRSDYNTCSTYHRQGDLYIYRYNDIPASSRNNKIKQLEMQIRNLRNRISLLEYLKGGK